MGDVDWSRDIIRLLWFELIEGIDLEDNKACCCWLKKEEEAEEQ